MKYTMIDGNKDGSFTLYGYCKDEVVLEKNFKSLDDAKREGDKFLDGVLEAA